MTASTAALGAPGHVPAAPTAVCAVTGLRLARGLALGTWGCAQVSLLSSQPLEVKPRASWLTEVTESYRPFLQRGT